MIQINCPWCGPRDEIEFSYRGDASVRRPAPDASASEFHDYLYARRNPRGWHAEWWHHSHGCRQFLRVVRHTLTHQVHAVAGAADNIDIPPE